MSNKQVHLVIDKTGAAIEAFTRIQEAQRIAVSRKGHSIVSLPLKNAVLRCDGVQELSKTGRLHCILPGAHDGKCQFNEPPKGAL